MLTFVFIMADIHSNLAQELNLKSFQVTNANKLFSEGATIPFISRYRKEFTGGLDEVQLFELQQALEKAKEFQNRKTYILTYLKEIEALSNDLTSAIEKSKSLSELEDLFLPYKPKRKTKAQTARENGLEPLAKIIMAQNGSISIQKFTSKNISEKEATNGALHIIAEWISENTSVRNRIREQYQKYAIITSKLIKGKDEDGEKFKDFFKFSERANYCKSHRYLALIRGENEGVLRVKFEIEEDYILSFIEQIFIKSQSSIEHKKLIDTAIKDALKRLLKPSIESELRSQLKEKSDKDAIAIFSENLKQLFMASPLGEKRVLAIDPGFKSGCKVVCLNEKGDFLHNETIYPHPPQRESSQAMKKISSLANAHKIDAIAIGNGTASRETEALVKRIAFDKETSIFVVNEAGASIYSASKIAREEFPQYDVTVRGAISIGRRLIDPLSELVKIEPKSIGVGQYQHDVNQTLLANSLTNTVEMYVNQIGVNINTASKYLLKYVAGIGETLADNIIKYRNENGTFKTRSDIKKVARMGDKAFEQCAGFLRIVDGKNPLDNSAIHPEQYDLVHKMAKSINISLGELIGNEEKVDQLKIEDFISPQIGKETLNDVLEELKKPGRDPRKRIVKFDFKKGLNKLEQIEEGEILPGIVSNVTNFGAFVDVGIKENGLIHVSELADQYISNPLDIVSLHQYVKVKVIGVDKERKRLALSLKQVK